MNRTNNNYDIETAKKLAKDRFIAECGNAKIGQKMDDWMEDSSIFRPLIQEGYIAYYPTPMMYGYDHTLEIIKPLE